MMLIKSLFIVIAASLFVTLMQGCSGASSNEATLSSDMNSSYSSKASIDTNYLSSGDFVISQAVSADFEIPTDTSTDPGTTTGDGTTTTPPDSSGDGGTVVYQPFPEPDPVVITPDPVVEPTPTPAPTPDPVVTPTPTPTPDPVATPTPTPAPGDEVCVEDEVENEEDHHDNGKHNGFDKNAKHYGYGTKTKSDGTTVQCKYEDDVDYCNYEFVMKNHKNGYKGKKFVFVNSANFKFNNKNGNYIVVATKEFGTIQTLYGSGGHIVLCGVRVRDAQGTHGRLTLNHTEIDQMQVHKGHLEIDKYSRIHSINQSQCSVHKR